MAADKPKNFEQAEKELEQYGSWVKVSPEDLEVENLGNDFTLDGDPENALMTEEEEMLLNKLEYSEGQSSFGDISFDEFGDLDDEEDDTFGMELPEEDYSSPSLQTPDLSVKILQSIENELVGLRKEVKDLKKELNQIQRAPEEIQAREETEDSGLSTGFFDEDDDETIALTGDELDNILESASVEEEPDLDELITSEEEEEELPEEFNESDFLDEDELQDTEDLIKDTELGNTLLDDLSLGDDDPALAELTETDIDFSSEETTVDFDLDNIPEINDSSESFEIDGESFEVEEFDGLEGESFTVEEFIEDDSGEDELVESFTESNPVETGFEDDMAFDEGEEIDLSVDDNISDTDSSETLQNVPFEDIEDIDLSSFDDNLVVEDKAESFENVDLSSFLDDEEEITVDIGPEEIPPFNDILVDEESLETESPDSEDEISLDEEPEEEDEISLDEIELEEPEDFGSKDITLDEISLDEEPEEEGEISLDEIELEEPEDFGSEDITLDEISLEEEPEEENEISLGDILSDEDEVIVDDMEENLSDSEIANEEDDIEVYSVFPEEELLLDDILSDEPEDEISFNDAEHENEVELPDLDEIILEEEENPESNLEEEIDLPDLEDYSLDEMEMDEIEIPQPEESADDDLIEDIDLPDLDEIILEDEIGEDSHSELPDLDEIVIDDDIDVPNLDDIIAETEGVEADETVLSEIELPDLDDIIIDDKETHASENTEESDIFGDDGEIVDLDSLEQLAVEEPENEMTPREFTEDLSERVEEIRDAAMNGNIPEELRDEIKDILLYMDQLLESLPDEKIQEFARSEHFEVYKKIFEELGIKK